MISDLKIDFVTGISIGNKWEIKVVEGTTHFVGSQERYIGLQGKNNGDKPIKISSWGFEFPSTEYVTVVPCKIPEPVNFPFILLPHNKVTLTMLRSVFAEALKNGDFPETTRLIGFFREQNGKKHQIEGLPFSNY